MPTEANSEEGSPQRILTGADRALNRPHWRMNMVCGHYLVTEVTKGSEMISIAAPLPQNRSI